MTVMNQMTPDGYEQSSFSRRYLIYYNFLLIQQCQAFVTYFFPNAKPSVPVPKQTRKKFQKTLPSDDYLQLQCHRVMVLWKQPDLVVILDLGFHYPHSMLMKKFSGNFICSKSDQWDSASQSQTRDLYYIIEFLAKWSVVSNWEISQITSVASQFFGRESYGDLS